MTTQGRRAWVAVLAGVAILVLAACGGAPQETRTATPPSEPRSAPPPTAPPDGASVPLSPVPAHAPALIGQPGEGASGSALTWTVPKEWSEEPPKSAMRRAQYRLPAVPGDKEEGECVVYYFGAGQGGDVKSNLERWADQFGGPGSTPPKFSETQAGGLTISRAEVRGTYTPSPMAMGGGPEPQPKPDYMLLGAIVPGADANWFFKCAGPEKTMEANRARFEALLASVRRSQ